MKRVLLMAVAIAAGADGIEAQELRPTLVRLDSLRVIDLLHRQGFEVAGVERVAGDAFAVVYATALQESALAGAGLTVRSALVEAPAAPTAFRGLAAIDATLAALASAGLVTLDTIGESWEGRPILLAKAGLAGDGPDRPNVLFLGAHHAREWISAELAVRLLEHLVTSAAAASLLATRDVWVIPVVNPDGYVHSFGGDRFWRKNRRLNDDGSVGVDLNRNYPGFWGLDDVGSSPMPTAETYRGAAPASEPETQAVMAFHAAHPPVASLSYHSYTNLVLFPYSHTSGRLPPELDAFTAVAGTPLQPRVTDRLTESSRASYHPGPGWQLYPTNGDYTEWAYRTHGTLAFTVELTAGCCVGGQAYGFEFPDDSAAVATVFADNVELALDVIRTAGAIDAARPARWESLWPELRVVTPTGAAPQITVGEGGAVALTADSLDRSAALTRWRGPVGQPAVGDRVEVSPATGRLEVAFADGAEEDGTWAGWARDTAASLEGTWHWRSAADTLVSPEISLAGIEAPRVVLWVRHEGSLFLPDRFAMVEISSDGGATWTPGARLEGAAPVWYPVTVDLPADGSVRLRVWAAEMNTAVDAVHVFGMVQAASVTVVAGALEVSENPVRSDRVFFTWESGAGEARVSVFTFAGLPIFRATVPAADGRYGWTLEDLQGRPVDDGVYAVAVEVGGEVLRRRLFVRREVR